MNSLTKIPQPCCHPTCVLGNTHSQSVNRQRWTVCDQEVLFLCYVVTINPMTFNLLCLVLSQCSTVETCELPLRYFLNSEKQKVFKHVRESEASIFHLLCPHFCPWVEQCLEHMLAVCSHMSRTTHWSTAAKLFALTMSICITQDQKTCRHVSCFITAEMFHKPSNIQILNFRTVNFWRFLFLTN